MLKLSAAILAVYAAMIGTASACISYDHSSNTFFSACDETMYVIIAPLAGAVIRPKLATLRCKQAHRRKMISYPALVAHPRAGALTGRGANLISGKMAIVSQSFNRLTLPARHKGQSFK